MPCEGIEHRDSKGDQPSIAALVTGTSGREQSGCCYCRQLQGPTDYDIVILTEKR